MSAIQSVSKAEADCKLISQYLYDSGLWQIPGQEKTAERVFRISPRPFELSSTLADFLSRLAPALLSFYRAANALYLRRQYEWVREYLDIGKPDSLVEHARMNYQKGRLPAVLRPDILLTPEGNFITELDSVPGGIGMTAGLSRQYSSLGYELVGGADGILQGFMSAVRSAAGGDFSTLAIVVSEESESYRPEMEWLASAARGAGMNAFTVRPEEVLFSEGALHLEADGKMHRIDVLYRFFELFDLKNIPKSELVIYAAKKRWVTVMPPYKHYLEEKMLLALFHHPLLENFWEREMGEDEYALLKTAIPHTWILDPRHAPPHTVIPDFTFRGETVNDWKALVQGTQKDRRLVLKPSGFSPLAWGSHGVVIGHDVSAERWAKALDMALASFSSIPYVLQHFHEGTKFQVEYYEEDEGQMRQMQGRVRLSPYYFIDGDEARLGGALATICPLDKKLIHGMLDAIMVPSTYAEGTVSSA